jgi:hypothetical protein
MLIGRFGQDDVKNEYQRLVYVSRSASSSSHNKNYVDRVLAGMIMQAIHNNRSKKIVGAIYYADGCFLQCLEGEAHRVDALYTKIENDSRHTQIKVLARHPIMVPSFSAWPMKVLANNREFEAFLTRNQMKRFDPYVLERHHVALLLDLMRQCDDVGHLMNY